MTESEKKQVFTKTEQRIRRIAEQQQKTAAKKRKAHSRRCYVIGERVLKAYPQLEEGTEKAALNQLEEMLSPVTKQTDECSNS